MTDFPEIDVVYTWVDGDSAEFSALVEFWKEKETHTHGHAPHIEAVARHRFRELDNLRHSLRSLAINLPWFRKLHIVTNGQVPDWLSQSERVNVVPHSHIFDDLSQLPTFNALAIEWCLPNIPGLAQHFVYFNDDTFCTQPTEPGYFFGANGLPKLMFSHEPINRNPAANKHTLWGRLIDRQAQRLDARFGTRQRTPGAHGPFLIDRERLLQVRDMWSEEVTQTLKHRFRDPENLQPQLMYLNTLFDLDLAKDSNERRESVVPTPEELRFVIVGDDRFPWRKDFEEILRHPPRFLCLNDDAPAEKAEEIEAIHRAFLREMFPRPSPFEKES